MPSKLSSQTQSLTTKNKKYIYPASPSLVKKVLPREYNSYKKLYDKAINPEIKIFDKRLRPYQNKDVAFLLNGNSRGNFNEQRLGKTPETLVSLRYRKFETLLIVAPKSTLQAWKQECETWLGKQAYILRGPKSQRLKAYEKHKIFISSYGMVNRDFEDMPQFDVIVIDEAHRLRNFKGQRSKNSPKSIKRLLQVSYSAKIKIALTGTPAPNYSYNIFPILHFLFPNLFTSYWNFINYYYYTKDEIYNRYGDSKKVILDFKPGKKEELQEFLNLISIQRKRKEHMKWIPEVSEKIIKIPMTKYQKKYYKELLETWEIEKTDIICQGSLDLMIRLRQLSISPILMSLQDKSTKTEWILDYIKDYPEKQILIVSFFTSYLKHLHSIIPNSELLIGDTSVAKRKQLEEDFNKRKFPILLGNIDVAKEGMKLEQGNVIIFVDPSLTYTDNEQIQDRIIPTTKEVAIEKEHQEIIRLITEESVEEYIYKQLKNKKSSTDIINNFNKYLGR